MQLTTEWDKTFSKSDRVDHQKVTFKNRYGITLAGDLYLPKHSESTSLPALAVSGPYGAVKEQASGLYAQTMAERGFVTLAFDPSFTGESGGEPRPISSPEINTEDFSAAVDFLGLLSQVDNSRIGVIGICGFGGMSLNAAAIDTRIKAVVTTSMYDMSRVMAKGYFDSMTAEERQDALEKMNQQRWEDAKNGEPSLAPQGLPEPSALTGEEPQFVSDYVDYYRTPRGFHSRSINSNGAWTATTALSFMNMPLLSYIGEIAPRPLLLIAGENAHSRYFSEDASKAAGDNAELLILEGLVHVDLYDRPEHIPFARIDKFFSQHLV
ncbi:alpha/beta hydrolase [Vibrio vulnificus]